jgi:hypothetical protein
VSCHLWRDPESVRGGVIYAKDVTYEEQVIYGPVHTAVITQTPSPMGKRHLWTGDQLRRRDARLARHAIDMAAAQFRN